MSKQKANFVTLALTALYFANEATKTGASTVVGQTANGGAIRKPISKLAKGQATASDSQVTLYKPRVHSVDFETGEILVAFKMPENGKRQSWLAKQADIDKGRATKLGERIIGNKVVLTEGVGSMFAGENLADTDGEPLLYDGHPVMFQLGAYYTADAGQPETVTPETGENSPTT